MELSACNLKENVCSARGRLALVMTDLVLSVYKSQRGQDHTSPAITL